MLPLDDRSVERFLASLAGRPELVIGNSQLIFGGTRRLSEGSVLSVKNRTHSVSAEVVTSGGADGVIVAQGGAFGGLVLFARDGMLRYCYNLLGLRRFTVGATEPIPDGTHQVRMEFVADGPGLGIGGDVTLFVDGSPVGSGRVDGTVPLLFSGDETLDVGSDLGTAVSDEYPRRGNEFTGRVAWVQIDVDDTDDDHFVDPEERLRVIMARQ